MVYHHPEPTELLRLPSSEKGKWTHARYASFLGVLDLTGIFFKGLLSMCLHDEVPAGISIKVFVSLCPREFQVSHFGFFRLAPPGLIKYWLPMCGCNSLGEMLVTASIPCVYVTLFEGLVPKGMELWTLHSRNLACHAGVDPQTVTEYHDDHNDHEDHDHQEITRTPPRDNQTPEVHKNTRPLGHHGQDASPPMHRRDSQAPPTCFPPMHPIYRNL